VSAIAIGLPAAYERDADAAEPDDDA